MNGDDSMALGTAFICANSSSNFKGGKKMELYHSPNYELLLRLENISPEEVNQSECDETNEDLAVDCVRKLQKNTTLYKLRQDLNLARTVSFKHDGDVVASIYEKFEDSTEEKLIVRYKILGIQQILKEMVNENVTSNPKINLRFKQDGSGVVTLKADLVYNMYLYLSMQEGPSGGTEYIFTPKKVDPFPDEEIQKFEEELKTANLTDAQKHALQMKKEVGKEKKHEVKKDLSITVEYSDPKPLTQKEIEESKVKLDKFDQIDEDRIKTMEKRNSLEAMIYSKKEWMESEESKKYSKENELETAAAALKEIYDWYEENSFRSDFKVLSEKYNELLEKFKHFDERVYNHKKLAQAIEDFESTMKKIKEDAEKLIKSKPWTAEYYNTTFIKEFNIVSSWFNENKEAQDKLPLYEVNLLI
jgi:molecular chaperone DnaK (HSP70)